MAISTNAILSIEQTLAKVLETAWQNEFTTLKVKLTTLVEMGEYDQAYDLAYKLDLAPLFSKHKEYIKYATYSAMLFGASRVTPRVERSGFAKGSWGDTVATVLDTFRIQIELLVGEQARKALLKELDQLVDAKRQEQISSVEKAEDRILKPFQTFDKTGLGYLQLVSQLHTSRVSAFGFTAEADIVGLTEYSITEQLDNRVCPVCEAMHGRTFRVEDARNALNTILRVKDPNELKVLQAWPRQDAQTVEMIKGMSDSDLISRNWHLPPYHPWCRGLLVRVGKVPKLKPKELGAVETPEVPEEITQDNFNNLGVEISNGNVEAWKATVGSPPEEFLSRVSGKSTTEFQHDLYRNSTEPSLRSAGISRFRIDDNGRVTVGGLIPGGKLKHWEIELDLLDRKWTFKKFTSKDYDHLKALWENWSDYFAELGLTLAGD